MTSYRSARTVLRCPAVGRAWRRIYRRVWASASTSFSSSSGIETMTFTIGRVSQVGNTTL